FSLRCALHPTSTLFPYTTLFRSPRVMASASRHCSLLNSFSPSFLTASISVVSELHPRVRIEDASTAQIFFIESPWVILGVMPCRDRKSTRLNSSHVKISYAVFCL